jgi:hypothetical protein
MGNLVSHQIKIKKMMSNLGWIRSNLRVNWVRTQSVMKNPNRSLGPESPQRRSAKSMFTLNQR